MDNIIRQTGANPDKVKEYFEKVIAPSFWYHSIDIKGYKIMFPYWK